MADNLTAIYTVVFVDLVLPDEAGGMVGAQASLGIPQYNILAKYDIKVYADQAALSDHDPISTIPSSTTKSNLNFSQLTIQYNYDPTQSTPRRTLIESPP